MRFAKTKGPEQKDEGRRGKMQHSLRQEQSTRVAEGEKWLHTLNDGFVFLEFWLIHVGAITMLRKIF